MGLLCSMLLSTGEPSPIAEHAGHAGHAGHADHVAQQPVKPIKPSSPCRHHRHSTVDSQRVDTHTRTHALTHSRTHALTHSRIHTHMHIVTHTTASTAHPPMPVKVDPSARRFHAQPAGPLLPLKRCACVRFAWSE
ncbi:hypothetical protein AOQ84DRAFT_42420 [Glonium stellatum]|uniref:Uncharacterized protein n=1 Tax=Glonium stellatum TaxID=574774 RepID=A0A8E2F0R9_9PEZI|nr:hypothetical protein AOQ84DRAFT_42420 [Glonium stellatum]